jgi:predicted NBD/HSP70 family sugar kinase
MRQFLTIDTGGTKTRIVQFADTVRTAADAMSAPIAKEIEIPTPYGQVEYIVDLTNAIMQNFVEFIKSPERNVVILATRGIVQNNILVSDTLFDWYDFDIARELGDRLNGMRIFVKNDARLGTCGAFSPDFQGRGLFLALGTGIGSGLIIKGELSHDIVNLEPGHMMIERDGEFVPWEGLASGKAWMERSGGRTGHAVPSDDPIWRWYADGLATGILALLPVLYPDRIVIGGKMAEFFDKYAGDLYALVSENAWPPVAQVEIVAVPDPRYTNNRGALRYGLEQMEKVDED